LRPGTVGPGRQVSVWPREGEAQPWIGGRAAWGVSGLWEEDRVSGLEIVLALVMLLGLLGTVIPYFPGVLLILAAALVWVFAGDGSWLVVLGMAAVGVAGMVFETVLPLRATASGGAPRWVFAVGLLGVLVGFFVIPVVGALVGGPLAIMLAEFLRLRDVDAAWRSTKGALKGIGLGILVEFLAAFVMIAIWVSAVLLR
jgi:uncharacterized protein